jgi:hypothetical protein
MIIEMCFGKTTKDKSLNHKETKDQSIQLSNQSNVKEVKNKFIHTSNHSISALNELSNKAKKIHPFDIDLSSIDYNQSNAGYAPKKRNISNLSDLLKGSLAKAHDKAMQTSFDKVNEPLVAKVSPQLMRIEEGESSGNSQRLSHGSVQLTQGSGKSAARLRAEKSVRSIKANTLNLRGSPRSVSHVPLTHCGRHYCETPRARTSTGYAVVSSARATNSEKQPTISDHYELREGGSIIDGLRDIEGNRPYNSAYEMRYNNIEDVIKSLAVSKVDKSSLKNSEKCDSSDMGNCIKSNAPKLQEVYRFDFDKVPVSMENPNSIVPKTIMSFEEYSKLNSEKYAKIFEKPKLVYKKLDVNTATQIKFKNHPNIPKLDLHGLKQGDDEYTVKKRIEFKSDHDISVIDGLSTFVLDLNESNLECGYGVIICNVNTMKLMLKGDDLQNIIAMHFPDLYKQYYSRGILNNSKVMIKNLFLYLIVIRKNQVDYYRLILHARNCAHILSTIFGFGDLDFSKKHFDIALKNLHLHDDIRKIYASVMKVAGSGDLIKNYDIYVSNECDASLNEDFYIIISRELHIVFARVNIQIIDDYLKNKGIDRNIMDFCGKMTSDLSDKKHSYYYKFVRFAVNTAGEIPIKPNNLFAIVFADSCVCVSSAGIYEYSGDNMLNNMLDESDAKVESYEIEVKRELFDNFQHTDDKYIELYTTACGIYEAINNGSITGNNVNIDYIVMLNGNNIYYIYINSNVSISGLLGNSFDNKYINQAFGEGKINANAINNYLIVYMRKTYGMEVSVEIREKNKMNYAIFTIEQLRNMDSFNVIMTDELHIKHNIMKENLVQITKNDLLRKWILNNITGNNKKIRSNV